MGQAIDQVACVKLQANIDLTAVGPLQAELLALRGRPVTIDASDVDRIGALGLQVLLSARKTWAEEGAAFTLGASSSGFENGLRSMGASFLLASMSRE